MIVTRRKLLTGAALAASAFTVASAGGAVAGNQAEDDVITLHHTFNVAQWPKGFSLTVGFLTDIHMGLHMDHTRLRGIVGAVNDMNCDVIGLGGDYLDSSPGGFFTRAVPRGDLGRALSYLASNTREVFGVPGNHDWRGGIDRVKAEFKAANIPLLQNQCVPISKDGQRVWIAGLDSQWGPAGIAGARDSRHDVEKTLAGIPAGEPVVMLMHEPDLFHTLDARVHVALAGHTHGGQVHLPVIGRPLVALAPTKFIPGLVYGPVATRDRGRQMFISSGVGCSGVPLRIGVAPEILKLTLNGMA